MSHYRNHQELVEKVFEERVQFVLPETALEELCQRETSTDEFAEVWA